MNTYSAEARSKSGKIVAEVSGYPSHERAALALFTQFPRVDRCSACRNFNSDIRWFRRDDFSVPALDTARGA